MTEWINPEYADVVEALRNAQEDASRPVRGFLVPATETDSDTPG